MNINWTLLARSSRETINSICQSLHARNWNWEQSPGLWTDLSREIERYVLYSGLEGQEQIPVTFGPTTQHEFQGRADRDCELCGKPDRHPNHNPEGKFNG